jgi:uncharacterized membrane protein
MWTARQILVVAGLIIQFLAVLYQANESYALFKSKKYRKQKIIGEEGMTITDRITKAMRTWLFTLILIFIGLVLQAIAEFV